MKSRQEFFSTVPEFSTDWEAKNLDGTAFRLTDHRGEVVVLYFWSTGCEYCMLAVPQISELAAQYKDKGVAVVGMFVRYDGDDVVPKHSSTKPYRGLQHLEAKDMASLYRLEQLGFYTPSTLVLDQDGKVREVFAGYSGDLGLRIRETVDALRHSPPVPTDALKR